MKKLLLIAALVLSGCGVNVLLKPTIDNCYEDCRLNGGVKRMTLLFVFEECICSNGASFELKSGS